MINECAQCNVVVLYVYSTAHEVSETFGLLEHLLEHEVGIATFLDLTKVEVDRMNSGRQFLVENIHNLKFLAEFHHGNIPILKINHLVGVFNNRTGIRTQEKLAVAYPDN